MHTHTRKALLKEKKRKNVRCTFVSVAPFKVGTILRKGAENTYQDDWMLHSVAPFKVGTILHKGAENTYQNDWMLQRYIYNNDAGTDY